MRPRSLTRVKTLTTLTTTTLLLALTAAARAQVAPAPLPLPAPHAPGEPHGALTTAQLRSAVRAHLEDVHACYAPVASQHAGRVVVQFEILGDGTVGRAGIRESTLHAAEAERCIATHLQTWHFPSPGARLIVSYPFELAPPPPPPPAQDGPLVLDPGVIAAVVHAHDGEVRDCYEARLQQRPHLRGRLETELTIAGDGSVAQAKLKSSTLADAELERCVVAHAGSWHFPAPAGGHAVVVVYPFVLSPPDRK